MLKGGLISILILLFPQKICRIFNFFTYLRLKSLHIFWGYQPKWKKSCNYMVSPNIWLEIKYINISFSSWNTQFTNSEFEHPQLKRSSRRKKDMPSNPLLQHLQLWKLKFGIRKIGCSMSWTRYICYTFRGLIDKEY